MRFSIFITLVLAFLKVASVHPPSCALYFEYAFNHGSKSKMKTIEEYGESHQNRTNKIIHWVCVPAIYFSIIGILANFSTLLAVLVFAMVFIFYARLDVVLAIAMVALTLLMAWLIFILPSSFGLYITLFILAWIGQFYGHKIEGKKPSFFKDLQFLLIGPLWCADAYLSKSLHFWKSRQKTQMASI